MISPSRRRVQKLVSIDRSRLRLSCRGKSIVSGVTTARVAPTLSNSSFAAWRAHSSAVQNGRQPPRKKLKTRGALRRSCSEERRRPSASGRRKWGAVSPTLNACDATSVSRSQPARWLYAERRQRLGANLGECLVGLVWHRSGVRLRIDWPEAVGHRRACRGDLRARSASPGALRAACPGGGL